MIYSNKIAIQDMAATGYVVKLIDAVESHVHDFRIAVQREMDMVHLREIACGGIRHVHRRTGDGSAR